MKAAAESAATEVSKKDKKDKKDKKQKKDKQSKGDADAVAAVHDSNAQVSSNGASDSAEKKKKSKRTAAEANEDDTNGNDSNSSSSKVKAETIKAEPASETKKAKKSKDASDAAVDGSAKKAKKLKTESGAPAAHVSSDGLWKFVDNTDIAESQIKAFLDTNQIRITTLNDQPHTVKPVFEFKQANFPTSLASTLSKSYAKPTFIQSVTWPPLLQGRDMVGIAATGSGKTVAFGIPALMHIQNRLASVGSSSKVLNGKPLVLVLSPTRELAMQIQEQFTTFGEAVGIRSVCIYGGVNKWDQKKALKQGMHIIVATPGRLIDLFEEDSSVCDLSKVDYLVLDEADRMLDIGFEDAIRKIVARLPTAANGRQTVMFSATWPTSIQKMANSYLNNPVKVTVGSTDLSANVNIEQRVEVIDPYGKESRLMDLLRDYHKTRKNRILIFALYKKEASRLEMLIRKNGYKVGAIHGDMTQVQRTASIEGFRSGACPLLIATDVAARGIDIPDVEYVINVTFPLTIEDYCHRIGRTGRAGRTGISHTFFTLHDKTHSGSLINILKQANQIVPPELLKFGTTVKKKLDPNYGAFAKDVDMSLKPTKIKFGGSDDEDDE